MLAAQQSVVLLLYLTIVNAISLAENYRAARLPEELGLSIEEYLLNKNVSLSKKCFDALRQYARSLLSGKTWALKMFDANGKLPPGILSGNAGDLGAFDQCLNVKVVVAGSAINGKYCLGKFGIPEDIQGLSLFEESQNKSAGALWSKRLLTLASCLPDACSADDFQEFHSSFGFKSVFSEDKCQTKDSEPDFDGIAIGTIAFLGVIICIMILSTGYDVFNYYTQRKPIHVLMIAFSAFTNGKKILQTNNNPNHISCLDGLRVISMMWIILGHRYKMYAMEILLLNEFYILEWIKDSSFMTGAPVAVDTFLLMSGLIISNSFMGAMAKTPRFNIFIFYLHRYLRLTPAYAAIILVNVSLIKHLGSGPQWPTLTQLLEQPCRNYWWSALLYIQNYVNPDEPCMGQTWYLSVDMHLFLLSPLILIPFFKWPKIKPYVLATLIICAALIPFFVSWFNEFVAITDPIRTEEFIRKLYYPTHTRAAPWFVGLATGYVLYESKKFKFSKRVTNIQLKLLNLVFWAAALAVLCACVFGSYGITTKKYSRFSHSMYTGFVPLSWAIALSYIIFSCVRGYGGPINWCLSSPLMQVVSRLTYSMYLLHKAVLSLQIYRARNSLPFGNIEIMSAFWGDFIFTLILAVFWVLAFESPVVVLEKVLLRRDQRVPSQKTTLDEDLQRD